MIEAELMFRGHEECRVAWSDVFPRLFMAFGGIMVSMTRKDILLWFKHVERLQS